ncbi:MAG: winged helix-turn-helix transcriptional regulator [Nitrososphaerota archaeon]|nr:winged helix-turn-helix transcriptional regulator [Nitrososphaerota archaeon]MDG7030560.1 winged helix-turn-helix transcriptional regulator [Nitrososphaerota archaeon]
MVDYVTYGLLTASFFFVALAFALLFRYRQVSQRINTATEIGQGLWSSLEQRLKKQDERILDVMTRMEVIQARAMSAAASSATLSPLPQVVPRAASTPENPKPEPDVPHITQQSKSQASQTSQALPEVHAALQAPDETQLAALRLLRDGPKNTRTLTDAMRKSREHTARIMKELFDAGLVTRNNTSKPFVYQLTDEGRRHASNAPTDN